MKTFLVIVCSLACVYAAGVPDPVATVLKSASVQSPEGDFQYSHELDNGISASVEGKVKSLGKDEVALEISGSSHHVAPGGEQIDLIYIADENGFQAQGAHLPTPPAPLPYPDHVVRLLQYIETHPPKEETYQTQTKKVYGSVL